jgi:hypothetical protein
MTRTVIRRDARATLTPVQDQGRSPSCLSHALTTAHEHARGLTERLSPDYLHYHATGGHWSKGATPAGARTALRAHGQPPTALCPSPQEGKEGSWAPPVPSRVYRRASNERPPHIEEIVRILDGGRLPVLCLSIPPAFYRPTPLVALASGAPVVTRHAVVGVAYGDLAGQRAILVRNSWGTSWGEDGHAWLSDDFVARHLEEVTVLEEELA